MPGPAIAAESLASAMTSPRTLLRAAGLRPRKSLGQNFLAHPATASMIVDRAGLCGEDVVLEIGPGLGALTIPIAARARRVYAVEADGELAAVLKNELALRGIANVTILHADCLRVDIGSLAPAGAARLVVMGNLPYNISSQVLVRLIHARSAVSRAVLMLQKEFARRLAAAPGGREYGRLTAMLAYCGEVKKVADVAAPLFFPRPKVDSEVVEIRFHDAPSRPAQSEDFLFRTIKAAFSHRRKTLRNALMGSELRLAAETAQAALSLAGIAPSRRAETLAIREFVVLSDILGRLAADGGALQPD